MDNYPKFLPGDRVLLGRTSTSLICATIVRLETPATSVRGPGWYVKYDDGDEEIWFDDGDIFLDPTFKKHSNLKTMFNSLAKRLLDKDTRTLIKAGFLEKDLSLTEEGKNALDALVFESKKKELVKLAEEKIEEEKESK